MAVERFISKFDAYVAQLPHGAKPSEERILTMIQRVWLDWKDEFLVKLRADSEYEEAQWRRNDMIGDRPEACTSAHIFEELRVYVSMKMGQRAWGTHQSDVQDNLIKSMSRKRSAMPATHNKKGNDKSDAGGK